MNCYRFIEAEKHQHAVRLLCRVLEVSRAAYYQPEGESCVGSCCGQPGAS